jgi:hypothetical protein
VFRGFGFAIPAIFATVSTLILGGGVCAFRWIVVLMERRRDKDVQELSAAPYVYMVSVLTVLVGMMVVAIVPDNWEQYRMIGQRVRPLIYSAFLAMSFVGMIAVTMLQQGRTGPTKGLLLFGSLSVIVCDLMASAFFFLSLDGMPLHWCRRFRRLSRMVGKCDLTRNCPKMGKVSMAGYWTTVRFWPKHC